MLICVVTYIYLTIDFAPRKPLFNWNPCFPDDYRQYYETFRARAFNIFKVEQVESRPSILSKKIAKLLNFVGTQIANGRFPSFWMSKVWWMSSQKLLQIECNWLLVIHGMAFSGTTKRHKSVLSRPQWSDFKLDATCMMGYGMNGESRENSHELSGSKVK